MENEQVDISRDLMMDANAVAGLLSDIFGAEMTAEPTECAHCGSQFEIGSLLAFLQGPGVILRCPGCSQIVLRIVQTPDSIYLDSRGAVYLKLAR